MQESTMEKEVTKFQRFNGTIRSKLTILHNSNNSYKIKQGKILNYARSQNQINEFSTMEENGQWTIKILRMKSSIHLKTTPINGKDHTFKRKIPRNSGNNPYTQKIKSMESGQWHTGQSKSREEIKQIQCNKEQVTRSSEHT
jgi:plasmid maintenance system killer protein